MNIEKINRYLAEHPEITLCDTTTNSNGYPTDIRKALHGFQTMEELKTAASELGGETGYIRRKDGWQAWVRKADPHASRFLLEPCDLGYNFEAADPDDLKEIATEELRAYYDEDRSVDDIVRLVKDITSLKSKVMDMKGTDVLFFGKSCDFAACETTPKFRMSYHYDTWTHSLAVILD